MSFVNEMVNSDTCRLANVVISNYLFKYSFKLAKWLLDVLVLMM